MDVLKLKNLNVLYVEDEIEVSRELINNLNYFVGKIIYCENGQKGYDEFMKNDVDFNLIITDVLMPVLDGKTMVDKIRDVNKEIPIIYTSAYNNDEFLEFVGEQESVHNLSKPIDFEELINFMIKIIDKK